MFAYRFARRGFKAENVVELVLLADAPLLAVFMLAADSAAASPEWTLAEPGDRVALVKHSPEASTYLVVKPGSLPGDFLLASGNQTARMYQMFVGGTRELIILDAGSRESLSLTGRVVASPAASSKRQRSNASFAFKHEPPLPQSAARLRLERRASRW